MDTIGYERTGIIRPIMRIPRLQGADIYRFVSVILFCAGLLLPCCEAHLKGQRENTISVTSPEPFPGAPNIPKTFAGYQCIGLVLFAALFVTESVVLNSWASGSLSVGVKSVPLSLVACAFSLVALPSFGLYVALAFTPYVPRVRRCLAALALICASASVVFFLETDFRPRIGWYVWVLSILFSITPEALSFFRIAKHIEMPLEK